MATQVAKRSVVVAGHRTSISLERGFWDALRHLAQAENKTINQLVSEIEESPLFSDRGRVYETDLRGPLSILLALVSIVLLVLNERLFHQTLGPGRERGNSLQVSNGI